MSDITHEFESRLSRPVGLKLPEFQRNERLFHVILPHQFTQQSLNRLGASADKIRKLSTSKEGADALRCLLSHKSAMFYFTQASTRTFLSLRSACKRLGMSTEEIRDPSLSSEVKGESEYDSIRMFSSYFDLIVMRTKKANLAECCAYLMNDLLASGQPGVPVINGGSGADQHPTQALLDIYTLQRAFAFRSPRDSSQWTLFDSLHKKHPDLRKGLDGKTYVFSGDIGRGRTVRSLAYLLAYNKNVKMRFVAPNHEKLRLSRDVKEYLRNQDIEVSEHSDLEEVIESADALYMTRFQNEHNKAEDSAMLSEASLKAIRLTPQLVEKMKEYAVILHPFPRNKELPGEIDLNPRARYFEQAVNGMWIRAALLAHIFDVETQVNEIYNAFAKQVHDYNESVL
ncbi:MAG: hypothetical protein WAO00_13275 [Chthoniobacterales bacterium]